jgi:hypothetical protein
MSKKKGFRTALATILIVLVIFAALTFAAIKYFLPVYQVSQSEVYSWAVKIFPLLIGITLIVIASMLGKDDKDDESEEDKLPPNSYDEQLFEAPKDDPDKNKKKTEAPAVEPLSDDAMAEFVSIFDTDAEEPEPEVEPEPEQLEEPEELEELEELEEPEEQEALEELEEPEAEPEVEPETLVESQAEPEIETPAPVEEKEDPNKALVAAINALVEKMDDFTTAMIYGSEEDEEEDEYEDEDEYQEPEQSEPEESEEAEQVEATEENDFDEHFARLEDQLNQLSSVVAKLAEDIKNIPTHVAEPTVEPEPVKEPEQEEAPEPETRPEPVAEPEPVDTTANQVFKDYEGSDVKKAAMAEYDSAKDFGYDLTIANVTAPLSTVSLMLSEDIQCLENGDSTLVIIPFVDGAEAKEMLDKLGVAFDLKTMKAGSNQSFESLTKNWIN